RAQQRGLAGAGPAVEDDHPNGHRPNLTATTPVFNGIQSSRNRGATTSTLLVHTIPVNPSGIRSREPTVSKPCEYRPDPATSTTRVSTEAIRSTNRPGQPHSHGA